MPDEYLIHSTDEWTLVQRRKEAALNAACVLLQHYVPPPGSKLSKTATDIAGVFEAWLSS
jgi:hypothetical protein